MMRIYVSERWRHKNSHPRPEEAQGVPCGGVVITTWGGAIIWLAVLFAS
jgi:hypothetical protein